VSNSFAYFYISTVQNKSDSCFIKCRRFFGDSIILLLIYPIFCRFLASSADIRHDSTGTESFNFLDNEKMPPLW